MSEVEGGERFDFGRVVTRMFETVGADFVTFALVSLVFAGAPMAAIGVWQTRMFEQAVGGATTFGVGYWAAIIGVALASTASTYIAQAAITHGAMERISGRRADFAACVSVGIRFFLPVLAIALLASLGIMVAALALLVPALILATIWAVVVPAAVVERTGVFDAFARSNALTEGHRWSIFGLLVLVFIASTVIQMAVGSIVVAMAAGAPQQIFFVSNVVISPLETALVTMFTGVGVTSLYYELRLVKEGVGAQQTADIFS